MSERATSPQPKSQSPQPKSPPPAAKDAQAQQQQQPLPRQQFTLIGRQGCESFWWDPLTNTPSRIEDMCFGDAVRATYSRDGSLLAVARQKEVVVVRTETREAACVIARPNVSRIALSPRGTYVLTWERMPDVEEPNMLVWRVADPAAPVAKFSKKIPPNPDQWPAVRWTNDEALAARLVNDGLEFYDGATMRQEHEHISVPGLSQFAWEPTPESVAKDAQPKYRVAVFVAERKGEMASVTIHEWPKLNEAQPLSRRKFLQAQYCTLEWSPAGGVLLANASTDMDPTGKSYYGQSAAHILFTHKPELNGTVPLKKEGGIHHMAWSPKGDMFAIIYGFMPAMTTVFSVTHHTYVPKADLGPSSRNTAMFSPDGSCLWVGGFQNLAGEMDFFTPKSYEKIGFGQAHTATTWGWSPDSNSVGVAICAPRRRVDNGYRFFDTAGNLVFRAEVAELYEFFWRPDAASKFPPSKAATRKAQKPAAAGKDASPAAAASPAAPAPAPAPPAKYRHPNATGWALKNEADAGGVTVYGARQQQQKREEEAAAKKAQQMRSLPPGCVYVEPSKPKRRQKKQADGTQ